MAARSVGSCRFGRVVVLGWEGISFKSALVLMRKAKDFFFFHMRMANVYLLLFFLPVSFESQC